MMDVDEQNGCLHIVKKSHLLNSKPRPFWAFDGFPYSQDILSLMQQKYLISVPMKAGQALIYDKRLFHGSPPNTTTFTRIAAICSLVPQNILTHFCYRESLTSNKLEVFEVEDEFYDHYTVGQKPEGVKSLGVSNYEVEPVTPALLVEKLETQNLYMKSPNSINFEINFKPQLLEKLNSSPQKVAILVSNEFEGFSRNGGIGTYYTTLSQKLKSDGWYVILLLCQTETDFQGEASFPNVDCVFSTHEIEQVLNLQPIHHQILSTTQQDKISNSFDYENFSCLFFTQAVVNTFSDAVIYIEFPEIWGFGYRTIQAKQTGLLGNSCLIGVTSHGSFEWLREVNSQHTTELPQWFWKDYHYEQFSYENADITYFPSYFLKSKLESYGWKTSHAKHLPYFLPILELPITNQEIIQLDSAKIPLIFFGRLEERKGLCTFIEAIKSLESTLVNKIQIIFIGKIIPLQSSQFQHLNSQEYIQQQLGNYFNYHLLYDLSSQAAIQFITALKQPIVCLTSLQENFPNAALEMGQLPVSLIVSDTGGFSETLNLIERADGVRWFEAGNFHALTQAIIQAIHNYPENPSTPQQDLLEKINQRLLNQKLEYMSQAFIDAAPKAPQTPKVTIGITCLQPTLTLLECLESLDKQTYTNFDVIVLYISSSSNEVIENLIIQAQTKYPNYKYLSTEANRSLGETYNYLVDLADGEYFIQFSPEQIALPLMVEKLVTAAWEANADIVVCPQATTKEGEAVETLTLIDGCLLNLLEFNYNRDISALFSLKLLKEFPYSSERGLLALNWQILAAAIATDKPIAYYPYPLYLTHSPSHTIITPANLAKERYYLRQYLFQIEPSKWNQRQLNLLLTGVEQLLQSKQQVSTNIQQLSPQSQAWMLTAQQIQDELTHIQSWNQQLLAGKDWLEAQWQSWMLKAQKAEVEVEKRQLTINTMQSSRFWRLRNSWIKFKQRLGVKNADRLQLASQVYADSRIRDLVTLIATRKIKYFQAEPSPTPVVSIISSFFNDYLYFETTYRSIINQTFQNWEWIIVDDASTHPDAVAFIQSLPERTKKIRISFHTTNQGVAAGRNTAIAQAQGKYLFFIDMDDIIDPTYIEKCVLFLETHPEFSLVNSYAVGFQAEEYWWNRGLSKPSAFFAANQVTGRLLYRKSDFNQLGGFDPEKSLNPYADWERWLKAISNHQKGWTIPEYLDCYRRTTSGMLATFLHNSTEVKRVTELIQSRYRDFFTHTPPQDIYLNRHSFESNQIQLKIPVTNTLTRYNFGKRILFFFPFLEVGGSDKFNLDLLTLLEQRGYDITIATTLKSEHTWHQHFYQITPDIFHLPNLLDRVHWLAFSRYIIESRQIDIFVISNSYIAYYFLPLLRAEFPQVAFIDYTHTCDPGWRGNGYPRVSCQFSRFLDYQVVSSQHLAKLYQSINPKISAKLKVCYTSIDTNKWQPNLQKRNELRSWLCVSEQTVVILFPARIVEQKRPLFLLEIIKELEKKSLQISLIILGEGHLLPAMKTKISQLGLDSICRILPTVDSEQMLKFYSAADIFLLPSEYEGISLATYEAMSMELPVVAADVGGQKELVTPETGFLIAKGNSDAAEVQEYVNVLVALIQDPSLRRQVGVAARQRVGDLFPLDAMAKQMEMIFADAIKARQIQPQPVINSQTETETLLLALEYMQETVTESQPQSDRVQIYSEPTTKQLLISLLRKLKKYHTLKGLFWLSSRFRYTIKSLL
ncbi:glycosyltransferase [Tolypothrix sp. PCC 7910]|nr:glycosyltransferase [Tolypothrix sp. PCC 7910]